MLNTQNRKHFSLKWKHFSITFKPFLLTFKGFMYVFFGSEMPVTFCFQLLVFVLSCFRALAQDNVTN